MSNFKFNIGDKVSVVLPNEDASQSPQRGYITGRAEYANGEENTYRVQVRGTDTSRLISEWIGESNLALAPKEVA